MMYRRRKTSALGSLYVTVLILVLVALSLSSNSLTNAAGAAVMKLTYDFVSVEGGPNTAADATTIESKPDFKQARYIDESGGITKDGFSVSSLVQQHTHFSLS
jgi:hypothetical protein